MEAIQAVLMATLLAGPAVAETLEGRVYEDHSGSALVTAAVRIFSSGERSVAAELETDGVGRFAATGLPAGEYRLELSKPNYVGTTLRLSLPLREPGPVSIRLVRLGVIAGRVTNAEGKPVPGGRVVVMAQPAGNLPLQPTRMTAMVDDTGQYRLYGLPLGKYAVAVSYASFNPGGGSGLHLYPETSRPRLFAISGGEEYLGVDFVFLPAALYRVSGTVELPAAGRAVVSLLSIEQPSLPVALAWTESDGKFRIDGIPPGSYELVASSSVTGYGGFGAILGPEPLYGRARVEVAGEDVSGISVSLSKGRAVSFVLRAAGSAKPPAGCPASARLALTPIEALGSMQRQGAELNFDKPVTIENLPPGRYQAAVSNLGGECYCASNPVVDLTSGSAPSVVEVEIAPAGSITGRLIGTKNPAQFAVALLAAGSVDGGQSLQITLPDFGGAFTFGGLPPGRYRIAARPATESSARWINSIAQMFEIDVPGGRTTEVELPAPAAGGKQ